MKACPDDIFSWFPCSVVNVMNIKPIPTVYKDVHFKSKLEARWALLFSLCGISWQYKPNGSNTAPDFKLSAFDYNYLEVKGSMPSENCFEHMRSIACPLIAVGGFFQYREPTLIYVTKKGIRGLDFYKVFNYRVCFNRACEHRFDLR